MQDHGLNDAVAVRTIYGAVLVPAMLLAALEGGANPVACLLLWRRAWPEDFPANIAASMAMAEVIRANEQAALN